MALAAARETGGAVDPALGATMRELGYDRTFGDVLSTAEPIRVTVRPHAAWRGVRLGRRTITLPAGVQTLTLVQDHSGWNLNYVTFS